MIPAPIGSAATPELAAKVSNAGGLGMLSITCKSAAEIREAICQTRELTLRPFAVNLVLEWSPDEKLEIAREEGVPVVSFFWDDPSPYARRVHDAGALVLHSVGSVAEARAAKDAGVDTVVAQGGIADGLGLLAALSLGASGVWAGTRFLLSEEARVHGVYRERVLASTEEDIVQGTIFDVRWPNAPTGSLRSGTVERRENAGRPERADPAPAKERRWRGFQKGPGMTEDVEALAFYPGQSAGLASQARPAADIVREMVEEAIHELSRLNAARTSS